MLNIRPQQFDVFAQAAFRNFEDRMIEHLKRFSPSHFKILEEADVRRAIRYGWERAQAHRLTSERSVGLYVQTMFMLGSNFDADPQFPWAAETLDDETTPDEAARVDRLSEKAWDYVEHVLPDFPAGDGSAEDSRMIEELRRIRREPQEVLAPSDMPEVYARSLARLCEAFPKKCEYVGHDNLRRLLQRATETVDAYGLNTERGVMLCLALMFVLGSGFDADPLLPWASAALKDQSVAGRNERVKRLYAGAVSCLRRWWA